MDEQPPRRDLGSERREELRVQIHHKLVEHLSREKRRYQEVVEQVRDVLFRCDRSLVLTYVNPAWTRLLGFEPEVSLGRPLSAFFVDEDREQVAQLVGGGCDAASCDARELRMRTSSGEVVVVEISLKVSGPETMVGSIHDVTQRTLAAEEVRRARDAAEAASLAKSQFLANMSHEIRSPMSAVLGFARSLDEPMVTDAERRDFVERIVRNGEHLLSVINDILDLSQIEHGSMSVVEDACPVRQVISDVCAGVAEACAQKGVTLRLHVDPSVPDAVSTDSTRLRQVLTNLVGNAAKFTARGAIDVTAEHFRDERGPRLRVTVEDTGIGIRPEHLEHIFAPFTQADASTARAFGGTGLGLAISRGLAQQLGGDIEVESELGRGSRFRLEVRAPVVTPDRSVNEARREIRVGSISSEQRAPRVLLAEDSPDLRLWTTRKLHQQGIAVVTAEDGLEACAAVLDADRRGEPFDVVLMDMQMPRCDGYEATRRLRAEGYRGSVIALTAHAMKGDRAACIEVGCDGYLSKPVTGERLLATVLRFASTEKTERAASVVATRRTRRPSMTPPPP